MTMLTALLHQLAAVTGPALRNLAILAVVFTVLSRLFRSCNPGAPWWRKPDLSTDICYAVVPQLLYRYTQTAMLTFGVILFYRISTPDGIARFFADGHGPLGGLAFWQQVVLYLLGNDLMMYLTHRAFHRASLWRFHAVHHSSQRLEWISSSRFHPVDNILHNGLSDIVMLLLGIPPEVLVWIAPFNVGTSALVHANLDWDFGPFRYVLASPVYHRWHHTGVDEGGSRNFAGTFPLFDLLFGTCYLPRDRKPQHFGVDEPDYPKNFFTQMIHPFRPANRPAPESGEVRQPG